MQAGRRSRHDDRLLDTALWWRQIRERTNESFLPLLFDRSRFLVLMGGGGSGKSIFAGQKILERAATEPGHRFLVVRKVAKTLRESCFEQLRSQAYDLYPGAVAFIPRGKSGDMYIRLKNGSEVLFAGLDDVEKLKSIYDITGIWAEEASELDEGDLNQLDIRLRTDSPWYLQIILTFNPISITHWLKRRFFDREDPRATTHRTTYRDNRFLRPEAIETLESFRDTDPYYYQVYCLGQWGVTGKSVFDAQRVTARLLQVQQEAPTARGIFTVEHRGETLQVARWAWQEDETGPVTVYKKPEEGRPYVIGCDTAGEGSDWFVAQVLDNVTGEQVAVLRHRMDEDEFTRQVYALGMWYNEALIGIECNFSSYPTKLLEMMGYKKQYVRETEDTYTAGLRKAFGFRTTNITRPVILGDLVRIVRDGVQLLHDVTTLEEMLTFTRNERLRQEAEPGAHDDCVLSLAIAYYIRPQQTGQVEKPRGERVEWTPDMWQDYHRASKQDRAYLRKKWGYPK